jgi:hypothetical protein
MGCICIPSTAAGLAGLMFPWCGCPKLHAQPVTCCFVHTRQLSMIR